MPAKRRVLDRARHPPVIVTPEQLVLWKQGRKLRRHAKYREVSDALQRACGLSGFAATVLPGHGHLLSGLEETDLLAKRGARR